MQISDFSKGLLLRTDIHKVPLGYGEVSHNNDSEQVSLVPTRKSIFLEDKVGEVGIYSRCKDGIEVANKDTYWAETCNMLYWSSSNGLFNGCKGLPNKPTGLQAPTEALQLKPIETTDNSLTVDVATKIANILNSIKVTMGDNEMTRAEVLQAINAIHPTVTYTDKELDTIKYKDTIVHSSMLTKIDEKGNLHGTYSYVYTYYDEETGEESAPSPIEEVTIDSGNIEIRVPTNTLPNNIEVRLYRLGGLSDKFTLVQQGNFGIFTDDIKDSEVATNKVLSIPEIEITEAPKGLKYLTYRQARLYGAIGNTLYFSNLGMLDEWGCTNTINFIDDITAIGTDGTTLLVFTYTDTYLVSGNTPEQFAVTRVSGEYGCINHRTVKLFKGAITWVSHRGINSFAGRVISLTQNILGDVYIKDSVNAEVFNDMYHVSITSSKQGKQTLVIDYRHTMCIRTISDWGYFITDTDSLNVLRDNKLYTMYAGDYEALEYSTGILGEAGSNFLKNYKSLYISYETDSELYVRVLLDTTRGLIVVNEYRLDPNMRHNVLQFKDSIDGYGVQINIKGVGKVHDLRFTPYAN